MRLRALFAALLLAAPCPCWAQTTRKAKTGPGPISGALLYRSYCASCHGEKGKGDGPVAQSLNMKPTDLTRLAQQNQGKFPVFLMERVLGGELNLPVHGSKTMPVWGPAFARWEATETRDKVRRLIDYVASIQVKPEPPRR